MWCRKNFFLRQREKGIFRFQIFSDRRGIRKMVNYAWSELRAKDNYEWTMPGQELQSFLAKAWKLCIFIWPKPASPVLRSGLQKKSKVVRDQLVPFETFGLKDFFEFDRVDLFPKVVRDQLVPFQAFGFVKKKCKLFDQAIVHGSSGFFHLNFFYTASKKKKWSWRWCHIWLEKIFEF